jgi:hypothetical protein
MRATKVTQRLQECRSDLHSLTQDFDKDRSKYLILWAGL